MIGSVLPAPRRLDLIVLGCAVALAVLGGTSLVLLLGLSAVALWLPGSDLVAALLAGIS